MKRLLALCLAVGIAACGDGPVSVPPPPPPPPPGETRAQLIAAVRQLAEVRNLDPIEAPTPVRSALVELGRVLAFDKILSGNRDISCMSCHLPSFATGDGRSLSIGQGATGLGPDRLHPGGTFIPRNSPPLFNLHVAKQFFWDGRVEELPDGTIRTPAGGQLTPDMEAVFEFGALSAQALFPVESRSEMRADTGNDLAAVPDGDFTALWAALMVRLGAIAEYRSMFEAAYTGTAFDDMTFAHASNAIAGFYVSELAFTATPWDVFLPGDDGQLTDQQLRGARSFMDFGCMFCHGADEFDDGKFHNVAVPQLGPGKGDGPGGNDDFGRERVTGDPSDRRLFKTPQLRNVELTAPYGHAGQFAELVAIVRHYDDIDRRLTEFDATQVEPALRGTMLDNVSDILANRDVLTVDRFMEVGEAEDIAAWLESLTDPAARDLSFVVPSSVPSGLPIDS